MKNVDNNSTLFFLIFIQLLPALMLHSLLFLPALIAGIVSGITHLRELFGCSLHGDDEW